MQTADFLKDYEATLTTKTASTIDVYSRILRQFTAWLADRPGSSSFQPEQLTITALDTYLKELGTQGRSISHRTRVKTVVGGFAHYLIEERGVLQKNPARRVTVPSQPMFAPRVL